MTEENKDLRLEITELKLVVADLKLAVAELKLRLATLTDYRQHTYCQPFKYKDADVWCKSG